MLKKYSAITVLFLTFAACKVSESPEFVSVENINILDSNKENFTLTANMNFANPNHVGGTINLKKIDLLINKQKVGSIQSPDFEVPAQDNFTVPLTFQVKYKDITQNAENNITGIINSLISKKIEVQYQGIATYKLSLFSYDYPVDYSEVILLKK
jgi:hypothetical protein